MSNSKYIRKADYFELVKNILENGKMQGAGKGKSLFLTDIVLKIKDPAKLSIAYSVAAEKLEKELELYMKGEVDQQVYADAGIPWWGYCKSLENSYPTYLKHLPALIKKMKDSNYSTSKNFVLFLGENGVSSCQQPCISLIQFQFTGPHKKLTMSVFQRSADVSLGLPSDIYQMYLIAKMLDVDLEEIVFHIGNAHIYENNLEITRTWATLLSLGLAAERPAFKLNT